MQSSLTPEHYDGMLNDLTIKKKIANIRQHIWEIIFSDPRTNLSKIHINIRTTTSHISFLN